jgi:dipeptidyl aminopeptidase/acylaminoacyl peptidase
MNRKLAAISRIFLVCILVSIFVPLGFSSATGEKKILTFEDIMKFKEIHDPLISEDGLWIAYNAQPDRGDGEVVVHGLENGSRFVVERGSRPRISKDAKWVAMMVRPKAVDLEKSKKDKPKDGLALLETATGEVVFFEKVQNFAFSDDSRWVAYLHHKEEEKPKEKEDKAASEKEQAAQEGRGDNKDQKKKETGSLLVLRKMERGEELKIPYVLDYAFDPSSKYLALTVSSPEENEDGLYYVDLTQESLPRSSIAQKANTRFSSLSWTEKGSLLAFLSGAGDEESDHSGYFSLWVWDGQTKEKKLAVAADAAPEGWMIPEKNRVFWSKDGQRLFFGFKPVEIHEAAQQVEEKDEKEDLAESDLFDREKILAKRELDVWHWNDPRIKTNEKNRWPRVKDQTYLAVFHADSGRFTQLADEDLPRVEVNDNPDFALGFSDVPYLKEITWYGELEDLYRVNIETGKRDLVVSRFEDRASLSPDGRYVVYYLDEHWHLFDGQTGATRNLTEKLDVPFADEDHDYPQKAPSYRLAGWGKEGRFVLIYDKFDIWRFATDSGDAENITGGLGRRGETTFRVLQLDRDKQYFEEKENLLLSAYHNRLKHYGFYSCVLGRDSVSKLLEEKKKFEFLAKAVKTDRVMYTRESFEEFPDIWVADLKFSSPQKVSGVNPQISEFAWGAPELVEWLSLDGIPLQGVLIKPADYVEGKRYPVIVYFYRIFSNRMYEFNQMVVNHRPNFPFYTSNGYAVFLPDVRFDIGHPGYSATKCLVPGVQRLIDMGIADPKGIGLHGHSWSGFQTAFVITQTNIFSAAVAGAPVSNMTSAYSGIRWESGLARQMQYEKQQSRIGGSLWEYPERYIENSPVFFADRIQTPLLIEFGDEDGAVPWYQGIELYLAMRRLGKDCIFLQYRGEPHHLRKYPNKLDYSIKMKEYFDHYLKGVPAPDWIEKGVPYRGK